MKLFMLLFCLLQMNQRYVESSCTIKVSSKWISHTGKVQLRITGCEFSKNQFNFGDGNDHLGNRVEMISWNHKASCDVSKDGTTETQILCESRKLLRTSYTLYIYIDGVLKYHYNYIYPRGSYPVLDSVTPSHGPKNTLVTLKGRFFTDLYGTTSEKSSNGKKERILRVYSSGQVCSLIKPNSDELYGITVASNYYGEISCLPLANTIGYHNMSVLISGSYGLTEINKKAMKISLGNKLYTYLTYPEITKLSTNKIPNSKLFLLEIFGKFGGADPVVEIGKGRSCTLIPAKSTDKISCLISPTSASDTKSFYPGNSGVKIEAWNSTDNLDTFNYPEASKSVSYATEFKWKLSTNSIVRVQGFFRVSRTGKHIFFTDGQSNLRFNNSTVTYKEKHTIDLQEGDEVQVEITTKTAVGQLGVEMYNVSYNENQVSTVVSDRQAIAVQTKTDPNIQEITFNVPTKLTNEAGVSEKQSVKTVGTTGSYCLSIFHACTDWIYATDTFQNIKSKIMAHVILKGLVTVSGSPKDYSIVYAASLGNVPPIKAELSVGSSALTVTVVTATEGIASSSSFHLEMNGAISTVPVMVADLNGTIPPAFDSLLTNHCPESISNPSSSVYFDDYEKSGRTKLYPQFCEKVYDSFNKFAVNKILDYNPYLCLAYFRTTLVRLYVTKETSSETVDISITYKNQWDYGCFDLLTEAKKKISGNFITLDSLEINGYRDNVYVGSKKLVTESTNINKMRTNYPWKLNQYKLTKVDTNKYRIELTQAEDFYEFDPIKIAGKQASTVNPTTQATSWSNGLNMTSVLIQAASTPVSGNIDLTYGKHTLYNLPWNFTFTDELMKSIPNLGSARVIGHLRSFTKNVIYLQFDQGGPNKKFQIIGTKLKGDMQFYVSHYRIGKATFNPIPIDMVRTVEDKPQVTVEQNSVLASCGANCGFESTSSNGNGFQVYFDEAIYDILENMVKNRNLMNTAIQLKHSSPTVTNSNYCLITKPNEDYLLACALTTSSYITGVFELLLMNTDYTTYKIMSVKVEAKSGNLQVTLIDIPRTTVERFSAKLGSDVCVVSTQVISCPVTSITTIPTGKSLTLKLSNITKPESPSIASVIPNDNLNVAGGEEIVISGSNFGTSVDDVTIQIGSQSIKPISVSGNSIKFKSIKNKPRKYLLIVKVAGKPISGAVPITYVLNVNTISKAAFSMTGGETISINGKGFGKNSTKLRVSIGDKKCAVQTVMDTEIKCKVPSFLKKHQIELDMETLNNVAWKIDRINLYQGESIEFSWNSMFDVRIYETVSPENLTESTQKLRMAKSTKAGKFKRYFDKLGSFAFRTQVHHRTVTVLINVLPIKSAEVEKLNVEIDGISAKINNGGQSINLGPCGQANCSSTIVFPHKNSNPNQIHVIYHSCLTYNLVSIKDLPPNPYKPKLLSAKSAVIVQLNKPLPASCTALNLRQNNTEMSTKCSSVTTNKNEYSCQLNEPIYSKLSPIKSYPFTINIDESELVASFNENMENLLIKPEANIASINPSTIESELGQSKLTIIGTNLPKDSEIKSISIGSNACSDPSYSENQIVCTSPPNKIGRYNLSMILSDEASTLIKVDHTFIEYITPKSDAVLQIESCSSSEFVKSKFQVTLNGRNFGGNISDVKLTFGKMRKLKCKILNGNDTWLKAECHFKFPIGTDKIALLHKTKGLFISNCSFSHTPKQAPSLTPSKGSIKGGSLVTITAQSGNFPDNTTVQIASTDCQIISRTDTKLTVETPAVASASSQPVTIASPNTDGTVTNYPSATFDYRSDSTPQLTALALSENNTLVEITSSVDFSGASVSLVLSPRPNHTTPCTPKASAPKTVSCKLNKTLSPGKYSPVVRDEKLGYSNTSQVLDVSFDVASASPVEGSPIGGQALILDGSNFPFKNDETIKSVELICGSTKVPCTKPTSISLSKLKCTTGPITMTGSAVTCDVSVQIAHVNKQLSGVYQYKSALKSTVTQISPIRGTTAGGTSLVISGNGFKSTGKTVQIDGSNCIVQSESTTEITCITTAHKGSGKFQVTVENAGSGVAEYKAADEFQYADLWSNIYTWGGKPIPAEGDFIVVPAGMTLVMDVEKTPVLKMLLINGGRLEFDDSGGPNVTRQLNAEYILVNNGGSLVVGESESKPFQGAKAEIVMHGHMYSTELPIYGVKCLAVRNGSIDLHGKPINVPWTRLANTANVNDTIITLEHPVDWKKGDEIVIASTGDRHSQKETEKHVVKSVSGSDARIVTLEAGLKYMKLGGIKINVPSSLGISEPTTLGAEVGLLTRNVVFRGNEDIRFKEVIPACPDGFDTGQFKTQTCFQGRAGEEIGSSQFGAHIMAHPPKKNSNAAQLRLTSIELTFVGQAFRLGRYPVHFHLAGDMNNSYAKGNAIHRTFNRAVVVHGTNYVTVSRNVIYDIMGGALFLEDGIEHGNVIEYNLLVRVLQSTSLLNDDITPAAIWMTNPNNTVQHNAMAAGTHFGVWFRMHDHPDGPSFDNKICPKLHPLGKFFNNSAHSFGWFGIWLFPDWFPTTDGKCNSKNYQNAVISKFVAWNNEKGIEGVNMGSIQYDKVVAINNDKSGVEGKSLLNLKPFDLTQGAMIKNSLIVGNDPRIISTASLSTHAGIVLPWDAGMTVSNVVFRNFEKSSSIPITATDITGTCSYYCGGFIANFNKISFEKCSKKLRFRWLYDFFIRDQDGSTIGNGVPNTFIGPYSKLYDSVCTKDDTLTYNGTLPASVCAPKPNLDFQRITMQSSQSSITARQISFRPKSSNVSESSKFGNKRLTLKPGWMVTVLVNQSYVVSWVGAPVSVQNLTYSIHMTHLKPGNWIILCHAVSKRPAILTGGTILPENATSLNPEIHGHLTGLYDNNTKSFCILYKSANKVEVNFYSCFYPDCKAPETTGPTEVKPTNTLQWTKLTPPFADCIINSSNHVKASFLYSNACPILKVNGILEFIPASDGNKTTTMVTKVLLIKGGKVIAGNKTSPYTGDLQILLDGKMNEEPVKGLVAPPIGTKAIGVFGDLELYGQGTATQWTRLSTKASIGDKQIKLEQPVNWKTGDKIVIATTNYNHKNSEEMTLTSVSSDGLTLNLVEALTNDHHVLKTFDRNNQEKILSAEVGLLSKNILISSVNINEADQVSFGGRILVSNLLEIPILYSGKIKLRNVRLERMGQFGYTDAFDPRFAVAVLSIANNSADSMAIEHISCTNSYSPCIGVFGTDNVLVDGSVIYKTVGEGILVKGSGHRITKNLIVHSNWEGGHFRPSLGPGSISGKLIWTAGLDISGIYGTNLVQDNVVAGSERSGIHLPLFSCDDKLLTFANNSVHSMLIGVLIKNKTMPKSPKPDDCFQVTGVTVYRAYDFGIYYQYSASLKVQNVLIAESRVGIVSIVYRPTTLSHLVSDKYVELSNSVMVGQTGQLNCDISTDRPDSDVLSNSMTSRSFETKTNGVYGMVTGLFISTFNMAGEKPFNNMMSYGSIGGRTIIKDTTFRNFKDFCSGKNDVAIGSNKVGDDVIQPTYAKGLTFVDTPMANRVFIQRPNLKKINPSDCVDMDCDGLKKVLIKDEDGSIAGSPGSSIFSQSEFEWDGDIRRGLGYYRAPKVLSQNPYNEFKKVDLKYPKTGIARKDSKCTYKSDWQGYYCTEMNYEMLVIESMDPDTETRRLSPIAFVSDHLAQSNFIDLINGPQDHGWCSGYTCQKRISTFVALAPVSFVDKFSFRIYFTGTSPQKLRLFLLSPPDNVEKRIRIGVFYSFSGAQLDIYYNKKYIPPINGYYVNGQLRLKPSTSKDEFLPNAQRHAIGTNYFAEVDKLQYVIIGGSKNDVIDIVTSPLIKLGFNMPAMTVDQFFGAKIVDNLAKFLGIPASKIRVVNVVPLSSRTKRAVGSSGVKVTLNIVESSVNNTNLSDEAIETQRKELDQAKDKLIVGIQTGELSSALKSPISSVILTPPMPSTASAEWNQLATNSSGNSTNSNSPVSVGIPASYSAKFVGSKVEGSPLEVHVEAVDADGNHIDQLGTKSVQFSAKLKITNSLTLNTEYSSSEVFSSASNGWAYFKNLYLDYIPSNYKVEIQISTNGSSNSLKTILMDLTISLRKLELSVTTNIPKDSVVTKESQEITVIATVKDKDTGKMATNLNWNSHKWSVSLYPCFNSYEMISWLSEQTLDIPNQIKKPVRFLKVGGFSICGKLNLVSPTNRVKYYKAMMSSSGLIHVRERDYKVPGKQVQKKLKVIFGKADFSKIEGNTTMFATAMFNQLHFKLFKTHTNVLSAEYKITKGSVVSEFMAHSGDKASLDKFVEDMKVAIKDNKLMIDFGDVKFAADSFYVDAVKIDTTNKLLWIILGVCIGILVLLIIAIVLGIYFRKTAKIDPQFDDSESYDKYKKDTDSIYPKKF